MNPTEMILCLHTALLANVSSFVTYKPAVCVYASMFERDVKRCERVVGGYKRDVVTY